MRSWWLRFRPMFVAEIQKRRIERMRSSHCRWHLDEMFVKINGKRHYLWRAVDHEGEVLESFVTKTRDKKTALKFLKRAMKKHGRCEQFVTDELRSYGAALKDIGASDRQETGRWLNNRGRTRTCRSDYKSERCCGSGACEVCRNSPPSTPPSPITSTSTAASHPERSSSRTVPPLSLSGAASAPPKRERHCPC